MIKKLFAAILFISLVYCRSKDNTQPSAFSDSIQGGNYEIHEQGDGETVQPGNWLKLQVMQFYNDSILRDSRVTGPEYHKYDSSTMTKESLAVFKNVKEGDSLEFKIPADSAFKNKRPAFAKKDGWLITRVKVEKIFRSEQEYQAEIKNDK